VGLSVSFPQQLRIVMAIIALLDERLGTARPRVIIGGLAINHFSSLADVVGADASSVDSKGALVYAKHVAQARGNP
jgi:methanogenic corrinoid protein MtbC1